MRRGNIRAVGPPVPCMECRTPFRPCVVTGHRRNVVTSGFTCPRCVKVKKAAKKRRKEGRAQ